MTGSDFSEITKSAPEKSLTVSLKKNAGRNNQGKITVRHRGGGSRRKYRIIDFKRRKDGIPATVVSIEYDPNRTANIALISYVDGEKAYILAPEGLKVGQKVMNGADAEVRVGNCLPLELIPVGTMVHNIELHPGKGGQMVRSAGNGAQLMAKEGKYATLRLPSGLTDYCKDKRPMFSYPKEKSSDRTGTYLPPGTRHLTGNLPEYRNATENSVNEVPMLPGDYKILSPAVLQKIKPLDESPECTDPDQLAARRYLADQGISLATAIATHIGCLRHYCITKNSEDKREQASSVFPCIAYVNYVDGRPVNAKYRSCSPSPSAKTVTAANASAVSGEIEIPDGTTEESSVTYSKFWSQDSPTKPCAPYNIDCINPLLVEEETIP